MEENKNPQELIDVKKDDNFIGDSKTENAQAEDAFNKAVALKHEGNYDEAIAYFLRALKMIPNNIESMYNVGLLYREKGDYQEALKHFMNALAIEPGNSKFLYAIASTYEHIDKNQSIHYYKECLKIQNNPVLEAVANDRLKALQ